jgi:hypothetical protein
MTVGTLRRRHPTWSSVEANIEGPVTIRRVRGLSCIVDGFPTSVCVKKPNLARILRSVQMDIQSTSNDLETGRGNGHFIG